MAKYKYASQEMLEKYASLAVTKGANVQADQYVMINAGIETAPLTREIVKAAYKAGARYVSVKWNDGICGKETYMNAPIEEFETVPSWTVDYLMDHAEKGAAVMSVFSPDPELLKDVDPEVLKVSQMASAKATKPFNQYIMTGKLAWNLVAFPNEVWAAKMFPELDEETAMTKLWEYIAATVRVDQEDPIAAWEEHVRNLNEKKKFLNDHNFASLHYKSSVTDLTVELVEGHIWVAGPKENVDGVEFIPNIPTEEVFTMNKRDGINGTLTSTMPLSYAGKLVEDFYFKFENGKVVEYDAKSGKEVLDLIIGIDEGASFLGEVALVPVDSPISNLNTVFYNTLYDENASCHFALGKAYPYTIEGGTEMSEEELIKHNVNVSNTHVDFMVGSDDLSIDGVTKDGKIVPIFRNGNWAF